MPAFGTRSTSDVFMSALNGSRAAQGQFLTDNIALVHKVVARYAYAHEWMDDLAQEASIGLLKALSKFDVSRGLNFSTYALPWMKVYIERFIQANMSPVSMPTRTQQVAYRVRAMLSVKSNAEIAQELKISIESVCALSQICLVDNEIDNACAKDDPESAAIRQRMLDKLALAYEKMDKNQRDIVEIALDLHPHYDSVQSYQNITGITRNRFNKEANAGLGLLQAACS